LFYQYKVSLWRSDEIRSSSLRYISTINTALDAIIVSDAQGRILNVNPAAERTFGRPREQMLGADMANLLIAPADKHLYLDYIAEASGPRHKKPCKISV